MVSLASITSFCVAAVAISSSSFVSADAVLDLPVGEYYRPEDASASPTTTAAIRRSPCPILNTLANHGYLPRDGKNVTKDMVRAAVSTQFNLDLKFVETLLSGVPTDVFDLSLLGKHGLVEHDASLVRADAYYGFDPVRIDPVLAADVLRRGDGKTFGIKQIGELRRDRLAACKLSNPTCTFGTRETTIALGEAGLIVDVLGGNQNSTISKTHFESFFVQERMPADYVKSPTLVSLAQVQTTGGKIAAVALAPRK